MKKIFFSFIILSQSFCLFGGKQEDLAMIRTVTERKNAHSYLLIATLKSGAEIVYEEVLSGATSGLATCSTTSASRADVSDVDYWCNLCQEKLRELRGIK